MSWEIFGQIMVAVLTIGAAIVQVRRRNSSPREHLRHDLEILAKLPDNSKAKTKLSEYIEETITKSIEAERDKRRDPVGITLGAIFIIGGITLGYYGLQVETFWRWVLFTPATLLLLFGIPGFIIDIIPHKRDYTGRRTK